MHSLEFLKLCYDQAKVFVAGNYWGVDTMVMAAASGKVECSLETLKLT